MSDPVDKKLLLIDTDACADDVRALVLALQSSLAHVLAVTTVAGSTGVDQAVANVARTLRAAKKPDVPIYKGANASLLASTIRSDASGFFGNDGIGDKPDVEPKAMSADFETFVKDEPAPVALTRLASKHRNQLTLICIGPLTNVAIALKLDPEFATNLKELYLLGGNVWGTGNVPDGSSAEFNFHCDPEAAHMVFDEIRCPITCVPWEAYLHQCKKDKVGGVDFDAHLKYDTLLSRYLAAVTSVGREKLARDGNLFAYCDEVAVAAALDEGVIVESKMLEARVELHGQYTRGQVSINWFAHGHLWADGGGHRPNVRFVTEYDVTKVDSMMHEAVKIE